MTAVNGKKISGVIAAIILASSFLLFIFGMINYLLFLAVAGITGIFAFKILPKMK